MKVVEIRDESELRALQPGWEGLLKDSAGHSIFLTWEWSMAWWSTYGERGSLRILAVVDGKGVLRGVTPLRSDPARRCGQKISALRFLTDGSNDSDYLDCIISSAYELEVKEVLLHYFLEQLRLGTVLLLNEIPESSGNAAWLRSVADGHSLLYTESDVPCAVIRLPQDWEGYLAVLKPRFRTKVRSVLRNLESRAEVQFGMCETLEEVQSLLPVLFDLHTRRWSQDGKPGVFSWDSKRKFYAGLSSLFLERGWLRFSWLKWNGQVLACQYGFTYAGAYSQLQEGYEPAAEHWHPGIGLRAWSIREFIAAGLREYDFLAGVGRHKTDWGSEIKQSKRILVAADTLVNRVFAKAPEWEERGRELVKRIVPERVLAARRQQHARHTAVASPNGSGERSLLRTAAANCYFYSRLPQCVRPLRDRYQLTIGSNGKGGRISLSPRTESCLRILYYHRVNEDNDPFFHAISTALFDQEMRYIARNYKVVSLARALDHLENNPREMVVAVTFDDGYQDNYREAFPILQRYGIPATVFLTTGSMDSGEPLWFERLSLALKATTREFIDLEIDIPRRLTLNTQAERLHANGQVFSILRSLPDNDRRPWLEQILKQLGPVSEAERKHKMLTWDEVRLMNAGGIDFGGHTVSHPFISKLTPDQVMAEVTGCKRRIEEELQVPVEHFSYPNGREEDFGIWNKEVIHAAGYRAAVTTIWGTNYRSTDRMELRRGGPWETSLPLFAYKLDWYQWVNG